MAYCYINNEYILKNFTNGPVNVLVIPVQLCSLEALGSDCFVQGVLLESSNWNRGLFSKCHASDIRHVCDFGSLGVRPWSFVCHIVLAMAAVMRLFFWQSLGLDQKSCFLLVRPISPSLTEKDKRNAFGNSILCCENRRKTCTPKLSLQRKRAENNAGCYSGGSGMADTNYLDVLWNMINFWWLSAGLTIKIKFNFIWKVHYSEHIAYNIKLVYMTLSVNAFGIC